MTFLDANVFIHAVLNQEAAGNAARKILTDVAHGRLNGRSSSLVLDEVIWSIQRQRGRAVALEAGRNVFQITNLALDAVGRNHVAKAIELMEAHGHLKPRDAIHTAVALAAGETEIISTDPDFDGIPGLKRRPLE